MGMTDNQYKDFLEAMKEDLEELNEYKEAGEEERYVKKYSRIMERLEKSLNRSVKSRRERNRLFPVFRFGMSIYPCNRLRFGV